MEKASPAKKTASLAAIAAGLVLMVYALVLDFSGSGNTMRGTILIVGAIVLIAGL